MKKKVGVLLSGCGVFDGSEIHEAVLTLLALDRAGVKIVCTAPSMEQCNVINHLNRESMNEKRNVLVESARITRGDIIDLKDLHAEDLDALILPGGYGAIQNLSNFADRGSEATVHSEVKRILEEMIAAHKPIGAICIAPATLTRALAEKKPSVTIGTDKNTAVAIESMGGVHVPCTVDQIHVDNANKIITTPAYMIGPGIKEVALGIDLLVKKVLEMI